MLNGPILASLVLLRAEAASQAEIGVGILLNSRVSFNVELEHDLPARFLKQMEPF